MSHSAYSVSEFFDHHLHVPSRTLYLGDVGEAEEIDQRLAANVIKALHILERINKKPIEILINTVGGDTHAGLAIFDAIHDSACWVVGRVVGSAMSMGAVILQACDERVMHPNSIMMLHDGSTSIYDSARNVEAWSDFYKAQRHLFYAILAKRTSRTAKYWERRCLTDYLLSARKALSERLIDRVVGD